MEVCIAFSLFQEMLELLNNATDHLKDAQTVLDMCKAVDYQSDSTEMYTALFKEALLTYQQGLVFFCNCHDHITTCDQRREWERDWSGVQLYRSLAWTS